MESEVERFSLPNVNRNHSELYERSTEIQNEPQNPTAKRRNLKAYNEHRSGTIREESYNEDELSQVDRSPKT
jgi:hypothetical protein